MSRTLTHVVDDLGDRLAEGLQACPAHPPEAAVALLDAAHALASFAKSGHDDLGALLSLRAHLARGHRTGALSADAYAGLLGVAAELSGGRPAQREEPRLRLVPAPRAGARLEAGAEPPVLQRGPRELVVG